MTFTEQYPELAAKAAESTYRELHLNCAESVFRALLTCCGEDCPTELVKVASGFGGGMGGAGCTCGALSGAIVAAGYIFGRTEATGEAPELCGEVAKKLHDAFRELHRATCCRVLHHGLQMGTAEQKNSCALRTGKSAEMSAKIIMEAYRAKEAKETAAN